MKKLLLLTIALAVLLPSLFMPKIENVTAETTPIAAVITTSMKNIDYIITSNDQSTLMRNFLDQHNVHKALFSFFSGEELLYYFEFIATQPSVNGTEYDVLKYDGSFLGNYYYNLNTYNQTGLVYAYSKNGDVFSDSNLTSANLLLTSTHEQTLQIESISFLKGIGANVVNEDKFLSVNSNIIDQKLLTVSDINNQLIQAYYPVNFEVVLPTAPTREGYTFAGWFDQTAQEAVQEPFMMPGNDVALSALWNINTYTLTFNTNSSNIIESLTVEYGSVIELPTALTREGYTFGGWYQDAALTEPFTASTMPANNLSAYAKWIEDETGEPVPPVIPEDPTDPIDPNNPTNPTDPNEPSEPGQGSFWDGIGDFFKNAGNGIGSFFKNAFKAVKSFIESDAGKWTAIAIGAVIAIAGIAGIVIWAVPGIGAAVTAAGGLLPALGTLAKTVATKAIFPFLKFIFTSKVAGVLYAGLGMYAGLKLFAPEAAKVIEETVTWVDRNIADPLAEALGISKVFVWPMIILAIPLLVIVAYDALKAFIKWLLSLIFKKREKKPKKQPSKKPKKQKKERKK